MKPCPYCAELIQDQAAKCRYCGEWLDPSKRPAWSQEAKAAAIATVPVGDGTDHLVDDDDDDGPEGTGATLPVGSGVPNLGRRDPEAPRTWSAPAWLANQARVEPREELASSDRSTLEEVALRMERIRQSAAAMRDGVEPSPRAVRPSAPDRATLEVEPGVTLAAGSLRAVGVEPRDAGRPVRGREAARAVASKPAPVVHEDELADFEDEPVSRPRPRPRPERDDLVLRSERPTVPDIPRAQLLAEVTQAQVARQRQELLGRAERPTHNKRVLVDHDLDDHGPPTERVINRKDLLPPEPELPGPPTERAIKRRPPVDPDDGLAPPRKASVPPPTAYDHEDEDDELDEDAPPRPTGAAFDDDFLDDDEEGDEDDDPDGGYDDFGAPGPAPRPLPWRPILIAAGIIVVAGVLLFRPYLFPDDPETDAVAAEGAEGEAAEAGAGAEPEAEPAAKLPGEGQPVQPDAKADPGAVAVGDPGQPPPAQPAAPLDADASAKLDEARKAYAAASGNPRKLEPVGAKLQEILAKAPNDPDALTLMAQVYLEQNKLEQSLETANRCKEVAPTSAACWLTIGVIQETKGADQIAKLAYQKYLDLAPDGRYAKDARKALARLE